MSCLTNVYISRDKWGKKKNRDLLSRQGRFSLFCVCIVLLILLLLLFLLLILS
uniref:Uncharacterized protein n=1 Tax=Anguilla anguilla TaxID=7936 RepID=A0A0E9QC24_ANGAN